MGLIQNLIKGMGENKKELKAKFKDAQENQKIQKMLDERDKSSNQRELESYFKKQREAQIKEQLDKIHKKQSQDNWKGQSILKSQKSILHEDKKALSTDKSILKQKNIFLDHKASIPMVKKEMFFR